MSPRQFGNVVYARLVGQCERSEDPFKAREKLDTELYAPLIGQSVADARLWAAVMAAPDMAEG